MRKSIIIIALLFVSTMVYGQKYNADYFQLQEVGQWEITLDSMNKAIDTMIVRSQPFSTYADTLSFIFELMEADSGWTKYKGTADTITFTTNPTVYKLNTRKDSIWLDARLQYTGPSGNTADTTTFLGLTNVLSKTRGSGPVIFGTNVVRTNSSKITGVLWIKINHGYVSSKQKVKFKIWAVKRWAR